ncbi:MAG: ARMT1-like domain-containing protein [Clostridia bacterium]|nr:ARMT1-like domain-containing protein [Clostridia bacterium]
MRLDAECKDCLFNSQLKKVEREQTDLKKLKTFKEGVRELCANPPPDYCAPLLMRDIDRLHKKIFGEGIDYSREKAAFNGKLSDMEDGLFAEVTVAPDPLERALAFAMSANYIDFARLCDLDGESVEYVLQAAKKAKPDGATLEKLKLKLESAKTLCYLHDNCGEIVLDKILIRVIKKLYPQIEVTSVVRGSPIINDVTRDDAAAVGLEKFAIVIDNGTDVPGTFLEEISPEVARLLNDSDVIISKGLGNLDTLYGEGYEIFYAFNCKCNHIAERFCYPLWAAAFIYDNT